MKYSIDKRSILELFEFTDPLAQQKTAFLKGAVNSSDTADTTFNAMSGFRKESAESAHNKKMNNQLERGAGGQVVDAAEEARENAKR